jgi:hypothetical protein
MLQRAKAGQLQAVRATHRGFPAVFLAAAFAMFLVMTGGAAQACPKDKQTAHPATDAHKIERVMVAVAVVVSAGPAPLVAEGILQYGGPCCGGGCHSHGVGCASGCCSSGSTAIDVVSSGIDLPDSSIRYSSRDPGKINSTKPLPNFRPPRTFV